MKSYHKNYNWRLGFPAKGKIIAPKVLVFFTNFRFFFAKQIIAIFRNFFTKFLIVALPFVLTKKCKISRKNCEILHFSRNFSIAGHPSIHRSIDMKSFEISVF